MNITFTDEEFNTLETAFEVAAPSPDDDPPPVPLAVVLELRYKLLAAQSRRDHAMSLTEEEGEVLAMCFHVGSEIMEMHDAMYDAIIGKLPA